MQKKILAASALILSASFGLMADNIPYPHPGRIAPPQRYIATNSGDVTAYFYGSNASYEEELGLFVGGVQVGHWGLDDHTSTFGQSIDFGYVAAGTPLMFAIDVLTTGRTIYSNPGLNQDLDNHAYGTAFSGLTQAGVTIPSGTYIGFEDVLAPRSDFNYTDEQFVLADVTVTPPPALSPEPDSVFLIGFGLICIAIGVFRGTRTRAPQPGLDAE